MPFYVFARLTRPFAVCPHPLNAEDALTLMDAVLDLFAYEATELDRMCSGKPHAFWLAA